MFMISAKVLVCDSGQNWKMTKTSSFFSIHQENTCKLSLHLNLIIWLTFIALQWLKTNFKINQFENFHLRSGCAILAKIWKGLKLLNSVPFIKKTFVNHLYIWIWSFWLTFIALQWIKTNFKISQFEDFC